MSRGGFWGWLLARFVPQTRETARRGLEVDWHLVVLQLCGAIICFSVDALLLWYAAWWLLHFMPNHQLGLNPSTVLTTFWWPAFFIPTLLGGINFLREVWWPLHQQERWTRRLVAEFEHLLTPDFDIDPRVLQMAKERALMRGYDFNEVMESLLRRWAQGLLEGEKAVASIPRPTYTAQDLARAAENILRAWYMRKETWSFDNWVRKKKALTPAVWNAVIKQLRNRRILIGKGHGKMRFPTFEEAWAAYVGHQPKSWVVNEAGELVPVPTRPIEIDDEEE